MLQKSTKYLLLAFLVWAVGSAYWYTCQIKYLCNATTGSSWSLPTISKVTTPTISVPDLAMNWKEIKAKPLTVYFGPNGDDILTEGVDSKLKAIVEYMKQNKTAKIAITGHTNYHKNVPFTEKLGLDRAAKLRSLLVTYGADANRVAVATMGQRQTVAPYGNPDAEKLNRRAIVSIIND
jgi:outer membrane protein OmpA-like peptidoglycan-associated protein